MGKDVRTRSEEISQTVSMISSETDIRIFVETNKSLNQFLVKEIFQDYNTQKADFSSRGKGGRKTSNQDDKTSNPSSSPSLFKVDRSSLFSSVESSSINDNYIQN